MRRQLLAIYTVSHVEAHQQSLRTTFLLFRKVTFYLGVLLCQLRSLRHLAGEC